MARKKQRNDKQPLIVTSQQVADFFDVTQSAVRNWKSKGCPNVAHNHWNLKEVNAWFMDNILESKLDTSDPELATSKRLYWASKARREQLRAETEAGDLVPRERIWPYIRQLLVTFKNCLLDLRHRLPPTVVGKAQVEMMEPINEEACMILEAISGQMRKGREFGMLPQEIQELRQEMDKARDIINKGEKRNVHRKRKKRTPTAKS